MFHLSNLLFRVSETRSAITGENRVGLIRQWQLVFFATLVFTRISALAAEERKWKFGAGLEVTLTNEQPLGEALSQEDAIRQLTLVRNSIEANYKKITTWQGEYSFADAFHFEGEIPLVNTAQEMNTAHYKDVEESLDLRSIPSGQGQDYWEITTGTLEFELDRQSSLYHIFYKPTEPVGFLNPVNRIGYNWPTVGDPVHWMVTPDYSLEFFAAHDHGPLPEYPAVESVPPGGGRIVYKRSPDALRKIARFFDPQDFFSIQSTLSHEAIGYYIDRLQNAVKGSEDASLVSVFFNAKLSSVMVVVARQKNGYASATVLDADCAFAPVGFRQIDDHGIILEEKILEFAPEEAVFLPTTCKWNKSQSDGKPVFKRSFDLRHSALNKTIPEDHFSVATFGPKYGERIVDELHNKLEVFIDSEQTVDAESFQFDPSLVETNVSVAPTKNTPLFWINVGLFVLLFMLGVMWRKRDAKKNGSVN